MSAHIELTAELREEVGKGASRRLRRHADQVPGIVYGGEQEPTKIMMEHRILKKLMEQEAFFSSILNLKLEKKTQKVVLKDLQRHPYKPKVLHFDLQRVTGDQILVMHIPLHFLNEDTAPGAKAGGVITHNMTSVEVRCAAKNLPEYIELDLAELELDQAYHLSDIKLPKGVELTIDISDASHDLPVVSVHEPRAVIEEEAETEAEAEAAAAEEEASAEQEGEGEGEKSAE
jgi:large subunit ribosomal protein L25